MTENSGIFFEQAKSVMKKIGFLPSAFMPYVVLSRQFPFKYHLEDSGVHVCRHPIFVCWFLPLKRKEQENKLGLSFIK